MTKKFTLWFALAIIFIMSLYVSASAADKEIILKTINVHKNNKIVNLHKSSDHRQKGRLVPSIFCKFKNKIYLFHINFIFDNFISF